ncbi:solute carrier family 30 member 9 [Brevipalpus obovatus]|uniref:solute carrier family 30 member 9 n=1 Tax=Brevipalpus obovatus TaxID=246614 RepID=UPI003D9EC71F
MGKVCLSRQLLISFSVNNINQLIESQKIRFITCSSHWFCDQKKDTAVVSKGETVSEKSKTIEKSFLGGDGVVKVKPKAKERVKLDLTKSTTERNFVTPVRAMSEYLLKPSDIQDLRRFFRRSPFEDAPPIAVYLRRDIEARALQVWGSFDALERERKKRKQLEQSNRESIIDVKRILKEYRRRNDPDAIAKDQHLRESGKVVWTAIMINSANFFFKTLAWYHTGSHSLFAEAIHSMADTCNQLILYFGIRKSIQQPDAEHPYGYHGAQYIASLISGVGIFCGGSGLSFYHGVSGLLYPAALESLHLIYPILALSLLSEGGTLIFALRRIIRGAKKSGLTVKDYVLRAQDPSVNVVLLEDSAAVLGVLIAGSMVSLTAYYNNHIFDSVGSLLVGGLLACVAAFIIRSNSGALVGRSIPSHKINDINKMLEGDVMIRAIHDVKATDLGSGMVRYKAEVDIDGKQLARHYLDAIDLEAVLQEVKGLDNIEQSETFFLKHGENIVDLLGAEIDRIEKELKKKHPQLRHVDLEVL